MSTPTPTLSALLARSDLTDHESVLRAANASLRRSKTDVSAQHARVTALLKLDRYHDALRALEEGGDALKAVAPVEYAYALYKTGDLVQALNVAEGSADGDEGRRGLLHVLAQTAYRIEDFGKAAEVYRALGGRLEGVEHEENDLRINSLAADAQLEWKGLGHLASRRKVGREDLEGFETAYNAACGSVARGELGQGEVLLKRARGRLCLCA
jgi:signal recognition particle subunit SRP72